MINRVSVKSINELHDLLSIESPKHPLVSIVRTKDLTHFNIDYLELSTQLYQISLKDNCNYKIVKYGRNSYDFEEATMVFFSPNQVVTYQKENYSEDDEGWSLFFHPDLIRKAELGKSIEQYTFFDYSTNEALHLSEFEKETVNNLVIKIAEEYGGNIDKHTQTLIISSLELLLNYCTRYYDRQFYTRTNHNKGIVSDFEQVLKNYYQNGSVEKFGLPTVAYCARQINLSPKYLSDLLRKETGRSTKDHIHNYIIEKAKTILLSTDHSVSEIAYSLGFEYPQHFSKMFKKNTSMSPSSYRQTS